MRKEGGKGGRGGERKKGAEGKKTYFALLRNRSWDRSVTVFVFIVYLFKWKEQIRHVHWSNDSSIPFSLMQREESGGRGGRGLEGEGVEGGEEPDRLLF
jgi:hypothetical protein